MAKAIGFSNLPSCIENQFLYKENVKIKLIRVASCPALRIKKDTFKNKRCVTKHVRVLSRDASNIMRLLLLTYLLAFLSSASFGQNKDVWTFFQDKDTNLFGFKDKSGNVRIKPRFVPGLGIADRFEHIVAVTEKVNGGYRSYYLTKTGKIVGRDSLHVFDNTLDCESEGFIRFHDRITDRMGMFNRNGEIAIPAQYNYLTEVRNGMIIALAGAEKKCMRIDKHSDHSNCEHSRWSGGRQLLIDTANHVLMDSFKYENNLNFFHCRNQIGQVRTR